MRKSMKNYPFVSIIIPAYNCADMIGECIESLLAQDYPNDRYEIIVVDNDSSDNTAEVIKQYAVKYVLEKKTHTSYAARNTGARRAKGELLAFCDADQTAENQWLSALVRGLQNGYAGVAGPMLGKVDSRGAVADYARSEATFRPAEHETDIELAPTGNVLYRRAVFEQLNGFFEQALSGADYDFSMRVVRELGLNIRYIPDAIVHHRSRVTLRRLLKHEARIAFGWEWVLQRHHKQRATMLRLVTGLLKRCIISTIAAAVTFVQIPFRPGRSVKMRIILIGTLMAGANFYGKIRYRIGGRISRNW